MNQPSEIDVIENFFQSPLKDIIIGLQQEKIPKLQHVKFYEELCNFQDSWSPPKIPTNTINGVILQSITTCYGFNHKSIMAFYPFEFYKKYIFFYKNLSILSPIDAHFHLHYHNRTLNLNGYSYILKDYAEFLLKLKPFVSSSYIYLVPPRSKGFIHPEGYWVKPEFLKLSYEEYKKPIIKNLLKTSIKNVHSYDHFGIQLLAKIFDDLEFTNQINGHYIAFNDDIIKLIQIYEQYWEKLPKQFKHSPLFKTSISSQITLPNLNDIDEKDMLLLRKESKQWNYWIDSVEKIFRLTHNLLQDGGEIDETFVQAYKEEISDKAEDLKKEIIKSSTNSVLKQQIYNFTVFFIASLIIDPSKISIIPFAVPSLLQILSQILFKSHGDKALYNHYSSLYPLKD